MVTERDRKHYAIKCYNNQQINDILSDLCAYDGIKFNLNKSDEIFTEEDYQEITDKGFKCNLINL